MNEVLHNIWEGWKLFAAYAGLLLLAVVALFGTHIEIGLDLTRPIRFIKRFFK